MTQNISLILQDLTVFIGLATKANLVRSSQYLEQLQLHYTYITITIIIDKFMKEFRAIKGIDGNDYFSM